METGSSLENWLPGSFTLKATYVSHDGYQR